MTSAVQPAAYYARQAALPEIGEIGQHRLGKARVLVIGAGGLGSPLLMYLAGAGIGQLGVIDFDIVEPSNLHRQILHGIDRIDMLKTDSAARTLRNINPYIDIVCHTEPILESNAFEIISRYDIVADGSDNFDTRHIVDTTCRCLGKTLVSGAIQLTNGILTTFKSHLAGDHPCFRCIYPVRPDAGVSPNCSSVGVLGPAVGVMGSLQAIEIIKELLDIGPSLSGTMIMYDALSCAFDQIELPRRADCRFCSVAAQPPVTGGNRPMTSAGPTG
jgi:adenylyltransferase/sulfurtransferase